MPKRVDANHSEIKAVYEGAGCTVQDLHKVGQGCPDIAVGCMGITEFVEIKDGSKIPSQRQLTKDQVKWFEKWRGAACVIENTDQALAHISHMRARAGRTGQFDIPRKDLV